MQNYLAPSILANLNHTIRNTVVISSYFGPQLIFAPLISRFCLAREINEIKGMLTLRVLQYNKIEL